MSSVKMYDAARRLPPMESGVHLPVDTGLAANTVSGLVTIASSGHHTFSSPTPFNILFASDGAVLDAALPTAVFPMAAGAYDLWLPAGLSYKVRLEAAGTFRHWKSGEQLA